MGKEKFNPIKMSEEEILDWAHKTKKIYEFVGEEVYLPKNKVEDLNIFIDDIVIMLDSQ